MDLLAVERAQDTATRQPPPSFPDVIGHSLTVARIAHSIDAGRLHHALLVGGVAGIGKRTLARGLACALLCETHRSRGCGRCSICTRVLAGRHPDLRFLEGDAANGSLRAEAARTAALESLHAPYEGQAHVIVLPHADRLGPAAANALLKSIEEPNPGVYWMLLSESSRAVLATLRSRSFEYELAALTHDEVDEVLTKFRDRLGPIQPDRLALATMMAEGSPGRAMELVGDPSVPATIAFAHACFEAIRKGPKAIFSGPRGDLWAAMDQALAILVEKTAQARSEGVDEADAVVRVSGKGKGGAKGRAPSKAKSRSRASGSDTDSEEGSPSKPGPGMQRAVLTEMCKVALFHLQRTRHGEGGLQELSAAGPRGTAANQSIASCLRELLELVPRNPNVRLALEATLLRAHVAVRTDSSRQTLPQRPAWAGTRTPGPSR